MNRARLPDDSQASDRSTQPVTEAMSSSGTTGPLDAIRMLRSAGGALLGQAALHGQLVRVEWEQEKSRLLKMLAVTLLGFACLLCLMLSIGALVLWLSWDTPYRVPSVLTLIAAYGLATAKAWRRFQVLSALGDNSFAATRVELAADIALLKSKL